MSQILHKDYHSQTVRKSKTKKKILEVGGKKQNLIKKQEYEIQWISCQKPYKQQERRLEYLNYF